MSLIEIHIPVRTKTPGNGRRHWAVDAKDARQQRSVSRLSINAIGKNRPEFHVKVTLTRISPGKMDRHNLPGALKHVIDGIADAYGVDDGDDRWQFVFDQKKGKAHGVSVMIEEI